MIQVRYNTNYGITPDQKRWRILVDGNQFYTNSIDIKTKAWTTKDIVKGDDGNYVEKFHISCVPNYVEVEEGFLLKDKPEIVVTDDILDNLELICICWSVTQNKWKVVIKGDNRYYDDIVFKTYLWTSDISPEFCCRPAHIGVTEIDSKTTLYLTDTL